MTQDALPLNQNENTISIHAQLSPKISFSLQQNGFPIIQSISISNTGEKPLHDLQLHLNASPHFFETYSCFLPTISPQTTYLIETIELTIDYGQLAQLVESEKGTLTIRLEQETTLLIEKRFPLEVLARNQWGGLTTYPEDIASFVQPNDPVVDNLLGQANQLLQSHSLNQSLTGYKEGKNAVWRQLAALWSVLQSQHIGYVLPPAAFEERGQKIRIPSQIIEAKLGTCLDISLLFASCLEQCGLHPLLIFTKGHAFAGCWLNEDTLASMLTDDVTALRKRIALKELIVVETTLLISKEPIGFYDACKQGASSLREERSGDFLCVLDLCRARAQHIKPLALSAAPSTHSKQHQEEPQPERSLDLEIPLELLDDDVQQSSVVHETPATPVGRMERWQRKLLDLSLRNSLLNFRPLKRFIEIVATDPLQLEDMLAEGERFRLEAALPRIDSQMLKATSNGLEQQSLLHELATTLLPQKTLLAPLEADDLEARLIKVYRDARAALEEGGSSALYMVMGFLTWKAQGSSSVVKAPLLLIPIQLERSVRNGFSLSQSDDEPRFNLTLLEMLRQDFGLTELDCFTTELPTDDHGLDVEGIWRTVQNAIKNIPGWEVSPTVALGSFSFAKHLMWKDLCGHAHFMQKSRVVKHLLTRPGIFSYDTPFVAAESLDATLRPHDTQCPLLADSSQLAAIASAAKGKDFVLIGPPGTGKSQTIANMIAQCLAKKQTVLFVAEKTAALNVVYRRLKKIGLGEFCLELHSNKANKANVLQQLAASIDRNSKHKHSEWSQLANRLCRTRDSLNAYTQHLHQQYPNGLTPFIAMGTVIRGSQVPTVPLSWDNPSTHDRQAYEDLLLLADKIQLHAPQALRYTDTTLSTIDQEQYSVTWQHTLKEILTRSLNIALTLEKIDKAATKLLDIPALQGTSQQFIEWKNLLDVLPKVQQQDCAWLLKQQAIKAVPALREAYTALQNYHTLQAQLSPPCQQAYTDLLATVEKIERYGSPALQHAHSSLQFLNMRQWTPQWQQDSIHALREGQQHAKELDHSGEHVARLLGVERLSNDAQSIVQWNIIAQTLPKAWGHAWSWVLSPDADSVLSTLQEALELLKQYRELTAKLSNPYQDTVFTLDLPDLHAQWQKSKTVWWFSQWRLTQHIKKTLGAVCRAPNPDYENDLPILLSLVPLRQRLQQLNSLAIQTEGVWADYATELAEATAALSFATTLRDALAGLHTTPKEFASLKRSLQDLLGSANDLLAPTGSARTTLIQWTDSTAAYIQSMDRIRILLQAPTHFADGSPNQNSTLYADILALQQHFRGWCFWNKLCHDATALGLEDMISALHQGKLSPQDCLIALHQPEGEYALDQPNLIEKLLQHSSDTHNDALRLTQLRALREQLAGYTALSKITVGLWAGYATKPEAILSALTVSSTLLPALMPCLIQLKSSPDDLRTFLVRLHALYQQETAESSTVPSVFQKTFTLWSNAIQHYAESQAHLSQLLNKTAQLSQKTLPDFIAFCQEMLSLSDHINEWCAWKRTAHEAEQYGLAPLITALHTGILQPQECINAFKVNYARWWILRVIDSLDPLKTFVLSEHEDSIKKFCNFDDTLREVSIEYIAAVLRSEPLFTEHTEKEWHTLQRELQKKKRRMPLRKLISSLPTLLPRLTPCFLMSPLSIAQYLQAGSEQFDVVIFDEASQIPVWDAVGAMARGKHVIVVGDPKQLPPTNFFQRADDEEFDEDDADFDGGMESILDECLSTGVPALSLRWHYRSKHEKLIAFANHRYYDGKLITFPSACTEDTSITLHTVGGVYERGSSRTNPIEARALVDHVVNLLRSPEFRAKEHRSVGIVTFNMQQQQLIEDLLDAARRSDPSLEPFFSETREEPVIVKNLENIQGDERDIMYFSIGFAPDQTGHMSMNFGALNREGGERRLNVAITRAREGLHIFCSIRPDQISLQQTRAQGVRDLRLFLEFAESGISALAAGTQQTIGDYESPFEEAVAQSLKAKGWEVHPQIGVSAFRIDLGIVDPDRPGSYLAGVECDGATYHSSATARDRDRLRESILRGLGWNIVRIWSTDWWMQQNAALDRLHQQLENLLYEKRQERQRDEALQRIATLEPIASSPLEAMQEDLPL